MALDQKQIKWLEDMGNVYKVQTRWEEGNKVKAERVTNLDDKIQNSKDELRMLFDFEVTVKRKGFKSIFSDTKSVKASRGTEKSWNPDKEFDLGYYMERIDGGELDSKTKERINRAYTLVEEWEKELTAPSCVSKVPEVEWDTVRDTMQQAKEAAEKEHRISDLEKLVDDKSLGSEEYKKAEADFTKAQKAIALDLKNQKLAIIKYYATRPKERITITEADIDAIIEPMMDQLEVRRELWDRLVRERIVPANMVPEEHNETTQQFKGANKLYQERMRSTYDPEKEREANLKKFSKGLKDLKTVGGNVAGAIPGDEAKMAKQINDLIFDTLVAGVDAYAAMSKKDFDGSIKAISDAAASAVSRSVAFGADPNIATAVGTGINTGLAYTLYAKKVFASPPPPDWQGIIADLGVAIENSLGCVGAVAGHEGDADASVLFREIGRGLNTGIVAACQGVVAGKAAYNEDPVVVMKALAAIVDQTISSGLTSAADFVPDTYRNSMNKTEDQNAGLQETNLVSPENDPDPEGTATRIAVEQNRVKDFVASAQGPGAKFEEIWGAQREQIKKLKPKKIEFSQEFQDKIKNQLEEAVAIDEDALMAAELGDFRQQLMFLSGGENNDAKALQAQFDANSIEKIIAQIEMDRMKLKMAEALFDTVVGLTAQFVEPVMMASATKDLIKDATMAVRRIMEFNQWKGLNNDAINACSVQGFAFANRLKNLKLQITDRTIKCVFELGQIAGGAVAASGIGAGAGVAVSKASTAGKALWGIFKDMYAEADLKKQWELYKKSLNRPTDHRTMRAVLRGNPTLSKYAMAYAGIKENDPIAKKGLVVCGLSSDVLQNPETNANNVVQFLETQFNEDPKLIKSLRSASWQKGDNSPTMKNWAANCKAAAESKDIKLNLKTVSQIDAMLLKYSQDARAFERARGTLDILIDEVNANLPRTIDLLGKMTAVGEDLKALKATADNAQSLVANPQKYAEENQIEISEAKNKVQELPKTIEGLLKSKAFKDGQSLNQIFGGGDSEFKAFVDDLELLFSHKDCEIFTKKDAVPHANVETSGDELANALRAIKPKTEPEDGECKEFADYCDSVATRVKYANVDLVSDGVRIAGQIGDYRNQLTTARNLVSKKSLDIDITALQKQLRQIAEAATEK